MARWARGEAEIEQLLRRNELEAVTGAAADGAPLLAQAHRTAATATRWSRTTPTAPTSRPMTLRDSRASRCWRSKAYERRPAEVTTPSSARCGLSLGRASVFT